MLNIKKVIDAKPKEHAKVELKPLYTPWGEKLNPLTVLTEHPTPQFERAEYQILNGKWQCVFVHDEHDPRADLEQVVLHADLPKSKDFVQQIVVPFSPESILSGVSRQLRPDELLWYLRSFSTPELNEDELCILHFQAVDYACALYLNGELVGSHCGGYEPFSFDITPYLQYGENVIALCVADSSEYADHPRGKQRFDRGDIWYTAQSGIWQSVWLEKIPRYHIKRLHIESDIESSTLLVGVEVSDLASDALKLKVKVKNHKGKTVASAKTRPSNTTHVFEITVEDMKLWSPDDPYLYGLSIHYGDDVVSSYCAFRKAEILLDQKNVPRFCLNGKPLFIKGILDQGYWPDGLMTAPDDEALIYDIEKAKSLGFNLMRKHIKIESERWYYHCDRLGMLVLQDMVQGGDGEPRPWDYSYKPTFFKYSWDHYNDTTLLHQQKLGSGNPDYQAEWMKECRNTVMRLFNHPSIIGWCLFNEGWGQFSAEAACNMVRRLDPTRTIDAVSGWYDQHCGDYKSVHNYFRTLTVWPCKQKRAFFVSEFGGYSHLVKDHSSLDECYGYEIYDDLSTWISKVKDLISHMDNLESRGLAGYVYTQLSDVEEETNGILTYDRKINKLS